MTYCARIGREGQVAVNGCSCFIAQVVIVIIAMGLRSFVRTTLDGLALTCGPRHISVRRRRPDAVHRVGQVTKLGKQ